MVLVHVDAFAPVASPFMWDSPLDAHALRYSLDAHALCYPRSADVFNGLMPGGGSRGANPKLGNVGHWSGAGVPQHDAFAAFLPDLDGDDPTMGLDIFSTSESGCSLDYMDATDQVDSGYLAATSRMLLAQQAANLSDKVPKGPSEKSTKRDKPAFYQLKEDCSGSSLNLMGHNSRREALRQQQQQLAPSRMGSSQQQQPTSSQCSTGSASDIGENEPYVTTRQNSSTHTHHTAVDSKPLSPLAKKVALAAASKAALKAAASAKSTTTSPKGRHGSYAGEKAAALPTPKEKKAALALAKESKRILKRDKGARIVCLNCGSSNTPQWRMGPTGPKTLCNACGVRYKKGLPLKIGLVDEQ